MGLRAHFFTPAEMAKEETPLSALGKLEADYKAKRISQKDYEEQKKKLNAPTYSMIYTSGQGMMDPATLKFVAKQYLAGDRQAIQGYARNPIVKAALAKAIQEEATSEGMTPKDVAAKMAEFQGVLAGERTLGTRSANIEMAVSEAQNVIPIALASSKAVDRSKYPTLNSVILAYKKGTGDPAVAAFWAANNALMNIYSRAIAPTGSPTVFDKAHAEDVLSTAYSTGQYDAVVNIMKKEMEAARKSPGQVRSAMREAITGEAPKESGGVKDLPKIGVVEKGYRYKGGDPGKPESWEKVK